MCVPSMFKTRTDYAHSRITARYTTQSGQWRHTPHGIKATTRRSSFMFKCSPPQNSMGLWFGFGALFLSKMWRNVKHVSKISPAYCCELSIWGTTEKQQFYQKRENKIKKKTQHRNSSYFFIFIVPKLQGICLYYSNKKIGWILGGLGRGMEGWIWSKHAAHVYEILKELINTLKTNLQTPREGK